MVAHDSASTASHRRPLVLRGGIAAVLAIAINIVIVVAAGALDLAPGFQPLTIPPVTLFSALGAVGATIVYWLSARYLSDGDRTFVRIAIAVLVLSFVPDVALLQSDPAATVPGVIVLMIMHVVVAAVSVALLVYWGRSVRSEA